MTNVVTAQQAQAQHPALPHRQAVSVVLFGVRVAAAALVALWLAMWLQLDNPRWAAWTVMSLALPSRGQVALKGLSRAGGTMLGLVVGLVGIAAFAQSPVAMGLFLTLWLSLTAIIGGRLLGLGSYGAALAGLTAVLVVVLSATTPLSAFAVALERTSSIILGVVCVTVASTLAEILHGPGTSPPPLMVLPSPATVVANAVRTFVMVGVAWIIWIATAWPSGGIFVILAASLALMFTTMPNADQQAWNCLWGAALGQVCGLFLKYAALTTTPSFGLLALALFPFLFMGGIGMTDRRTIAPTLGYNISFLLAVQPTNPMQYDLSSSLNEAMAVFAGVAFTIAAFRIILPQRAWRLP
ncbi:FUSC family protein [Methylobacterium sp. ID0610]|uniref:FUSC family protein n=1 Tax=Methylobacterium carpenticola TaxID=3344827 RepID=UPI00369F7C58